MSITKLITAIKGGSGSGNFGHSGRPGKQGGSAGNGSVITNVFNTVAEFNDKYGDQGVLSNAAITEVLNKADVLYRGIDPSALDSMIAELRSGSMTSRDWTMGERSSGDKSDTVSFTLSPVVASTFGQESGRFTAVFEFNKHKLLGDLTPIHYSPGVSQQLMWEKEIVGKHIKVNLNSVNKVILKYQLDPFQSSNRDYEMNQAMQHAKELSGFGIDVEVNLIG